MAELGKGPGAHHYWTPVRRTAAQNSLGPGKPAVFLAPPFLSTSTQQAVFQSPIEAVTMTSRIDKTIARQEEKFVALSAFDEDGVVNSYL
jgi:hypothetical protein